MHVHNNLRKYECIHAHAYSEAMSHAALLLALDDSAGTRYSETKGRLPAWRTVVNAMIPAAKFMDVRTDAPVATLWWNVPEQLLPLERRATL
jgi:hypothetical protein